MSSVVLGICIHHVRTAGNMSPQQLWVNGMLRYANSNHTATNELFSSPPSLSVRLEDALAHFNINPQLIEPQSNFSTHNFTYTVDSATDHALHMAIAPITDLKEKYKMAVQLLRTVAP